MTSSDDDSAGLATCWSCGESVTAERLEVEVMIHSRSGDDGGPYRSTRCTGCGTRNGALRNAAGRWMLYPLEGLDEPTLIDWISPRTSREHLRGAVGWWERHRGSVERFRREAPTTNGGAPPPPRTPPRPRPRTREQARAEPRASTPPPPPRPPPTPPPPPPPREPPPRAAEPRLRDPHVLLDIAPGSDAATIRTAYRRALKLCHPDRVANLDPEIQDLAHRKSKALRRAYESLLSRAERDGAG